MPRITFSCSDEEHAQLHWLCRHTLRKPSNLLSLLVRRECSRLLDAMDDDSQAAAVSSIQGETL